MSKNDVARTALRIAFIALCAAGLVLAFQYSPQLVKLSGWPRVQRYFSFLTMVGNSLCLAGMIAATFAPASRLGRFASAPATRLAMTTLLLQIGIAYHLLLAPGYPDRGTLADVASRLLHYTTPAVMLLDWVLFGPRQVRFGQAWAALVVPAVYALWAFAQGLAIHWWPYPFMNPDRIGWGAVAGYMLGIGAFTFLTAVGLATLDKALPRGHGVKPAAA